jgi:Arc/MetJ family transcription regulator
MATNLGIDEKLLNEAQALSGQSTKKATVNEALRRYILHLQQLKAIESFGKFDWDPDYDYKRERNRKRGGAKP